MMILMTTLGSGINHILKSVAFYNVGICKTMFLSILSTINKNNKTVLILVASTLVRP